jgi:hypothetical protein
MKTISNAPRRTRRLRNAAGALVAATALAFGATACEPTGCQLDCIGTVSTDVGATKFKVETTVPTKMLLLVYTDPGMTNLHGAYANGSFGTTHSFSVGQLKGATNYYWRATATDENGNQRIETGSVKTFRREVSVTINRIKLVDDSDLLGSGELEFHLKVNDAVFQDVYVNRNMASGADIKNLTITRTNTNTNNPVTILVEGLDDDCDAGLCTGGGYPSFDSGTNGDADWATATFGPITVPAQDGSGSWSAQTKAHALKFEVYGTWKVTYKAL